MSTLKYSKFLKSVVLLAGLSLASISYATISVTPMEIEFLPSNSLKQDVLIKNPGDKPAYVAVTPYVMKDPGTKRERKVHVVDPKKSGILVMPNRLMIPANQQRHVRILLTKPLDKTEKVFRLSFIPQEDLLVPPNLKEKLKQPAMGLHLIIGYGILAVARPQVLRPELLIKRRGHNLNIKNVGNTMLVLRGGQQCKGKKCFTVPTRRLYAGNAWTTKLPYTTPVKLKGLLSNKPMTFNSN